MSDLFAEASTGTPPPRASDRAKRVSKELVGPTPLIVAVEANAKETVDVLIAHGARVDEMVAMGFSALHISASLPERGEITTALAQAGGNVNLAAEEGVTPLMAAAQHGHADSLTALLEFGADPNLAGEEACTPLHLVAVEGHDHIVSALCEAGADPSLPMKNDFTPLDFAAEFNHVHTAELLCSYSAMPRGEAALQASRAGHMDLARWLEASEEWITPLHHLLVVPPERAYRLLRDGADLHACTQPGRPSPFSLACELADRGEVEAGSTAALVLDAAEPWSPATHALFPHEARAQAVEVLLLGWQLSRCSPVFAGREQALTDAWLSCVMPEAIQR